MAEQIEAALTTMRVDNAEIGRRTATFLLAPLGGGNAEPPAALESRLVIRNSTGSAPLPWSR